ncbi:MAG: lysoplasmalogenase [Kurthia sp.]|nr:lysoplasmalogenase [Candidatus Kurthia equi]
MVTRHYLFLLGAIFALIYIFFVPDYSPLLFSIFIKIMPLICLLAFLLLLPDAFNSSFKRWLTLGLFFCMLGDATLHWFLIGLTFFLLGHLFYIVAFLRIQEKPPSKWAMLILLFYGIILAAWIIGNVLRSGNIILSIAIIFYVAVILTMVWAALQTNITTILMGALLFLLSDSILALNMFVTDIHYSTLLIMTTYYIAQFMFTISVPKHFVIRTKVLE